MSLVIWTLFRGKQRRHSGNGCWRLRLCQTHTHKCRAVCSLPEGLHNMGAIKDHPLLSSADFLREKKTERKKEHRRSLGKASFVQQEVILLSVFICGLPISCQTQTLLVALTGHVNTHADHT